MDELWKPQSPCLLVVQRMLLALCSFGLRTLYADFGFDVDMLHALSNKNVRAQRTWQEVFLIKCHAEYVDASPSTNNLLQRRLCMRSEVSVLAYV
jgi:hypothetical protein